MKFKLLFNRQQLKALSAIFIISIFCISVVIFSLQQVMQTLLEKDANMSGMRWAEQVEKNTPNIGQIRAGTADAYEQLSGLDYLSEAGQIYRYDYINAVGQLVFTIGSYHPQTSTEEAAHHAHSHPEDAAISSVQPSELAVNLNRDLQHKIHRQVVSEDHLHSVGLHSGDGISSPDYYAVVIHPIMLKGVFKGAIVMYVDQSEKRNLFKNTMISLAFILLAASLLGFTLISYVYLKLRKKADKALVKANFFENYDVSTGLLNRDAFFKAVDAFIDSERGKKIRHAMYYMDMDEFQKINYKYGQEVGDVLLKEIGNTLNSVANAQCIVSRLGNDIFAVFQIHSNTDESVERSIGQLQSLIAREYRVNQHTISLSMTLGVALTSGHETSSENILSCAEIALHYAKKSARGQHLIYREGMKKSLQQRAELENKIIMAQRNSGFEIHYQPFFAAHNTKLMGFEALIRLPSQGGNYISPAEFIPLAEELSLIDDIGAWVLNEAMRFAGSWPDELILAVNLSTRQFEANTLVATVREALQKNQFPATRLELEITEGLILQDTESNIGQLQQLKDMGISISMDDFGTGYSSLAYLWRFPFDKIKIDQSFLHNFTQQRKKTSDIVRTIITLAHSLDMQVTAEGVDTLQKKDMLQREKCDLLQGYYLAKPLPTDRVTTMLAQFERLSNQVK